MSSIGVGDCVEDQFLPRLWFIAAVLLEEHSGVKDLYVCNTISGSFGERKFERQ